MNAVERQKEMMRWSKLNIFVLEEQSAKDQDTEMGDQPRSPNLL